MISYMMICTLPDYGLVWSNSKLSRLSCLPSFLLCSLLLCRHSSFWLLLAPLLALSFAFWLWLNLKLQNCCGMPASTRPDYFQSSITHHLLLPI